MHKDWSATRRWRGAAPIGICRPVASVAMGCKQEAADLPGLATAGALKDIDDEWVNGPLKPLSNESRIAPRCHSSNPIYCAYIVSTQLKVA